MADDNNSESCSASVSAHSDISQISGLSALSNISATLPANQMKATTGLDKRISGDDIIGSEFYVSPEMVEKREFSYASDLWALGVIVFQMFTG